MESSFTDSDLISAQGEPRKAIVYIIPSIHRWNDRLCSGKSKRKNTNFTCRCCDFKQVRDGRGHRFGGPRLKLEELKVRARLGIPLQVGLLVFQVGGNVKAATSPHFHLPSWHCHPPHCNKSTFPGTFFSHARLQLNSISGRKPSSDLRLPRRHTHTSMQSTSGATTRTLTYIASTHADGLTGFN